GRGGPRPRPRGPPATLRPVPDRRLQDTDRLQLHSQPAAPAQSGTERAPRQLRARGRPRGIMVAARRDDLSLQAAQGHAVASQAARQWPRADRGGRSLQPRACPHRQGNPQSYLLAMMDRAEAVDRYTVKVTPSEPYPCF